MKTRVVNIKDGVPYDVYCGRAGHGEVGTFGNPYGRDSTIPRTESIRLFERYFTARLAEDRLFHLAVVALKGKVLGCFCKPKPCHVDVIAAWVDAHDLGTCAVCTRPT